MSRKFAVALVSVVALIAALLSPAAVAGESGRACTDIVAGGGSYDPDDTYPIIAENTGPDGWLTQFSIFLRAAACQGVTYTMYVMDDESDLATAPYGDPGFKPLVEIVKTHEAAAYDQSTRQHYIEFAEDDVRVTDDDGGQDGSICVFHVVASPGGHVFDYGSPDGQLCKTLSASSGATSYR